MPNKTIYVAEADLELFQRAQELAGGNLSQAITRALRRFIAAEEGALAGFREITVGVGPGQARQQRFMGVLVAELGSSTSDAVQNVRVYRTRGGRYAVHTERSAQHTWTAGKDGTATGWRKHVSADYARREVAQEERQRLFEAFSEAIRLRDVEKLASVLASSGWRTMELNSSTGNNT